MDAPENGRRETRLLLVTITIAVVMLTLLARFRFPDEAALQPTTAAAAPLERLAARATNDELATIMADVERRITPTMVVVAVQRERGETAYVPAVRFAPDRAIAVLGPGERLAGGPAWDGQSTIGRDLTRHLVVVHVAARPGDVVTPRTGTPRPGPKYLAVAEATPRGVAVRPVYFGRTDVFTNPRTGDALLSVGAVQQTVPRGSAVFTLEGTFMGLAVEVDGLVALQPAQALLAAAEAVSVAPGAAADLGLEVHDLSQSLARAAGTTSGVMVSYVDPLGPSAGRVRPTDVLQMIDGLPVTSAASYQQLLATREPGALLTLTLVRGRKPLAETVRLLGPGTLETATDSGGLLLETRPGTGAEVVATAPASPAARAGLQVGDVIIALDGREAPAASEVLSAYGTAGSGDTLLMAVRRGSQRRVIALEKP